MTPKEIDELRTKLAAAEAENRNERAIWSRIMERITGNGTYATSEIEPAIAAWVETHEHCVGCGTKLECPTDFRRSAEAEKARAVAEAWEKANLICQRIAIAVRDSGEQVDGGKVWPVARADQCMRTAMNCADAIRAAALRESGKETKP